MTHRSANRGTNLVMKTYRRTALNLALVAVLANSQITGAQQVSILPASEQVTPSGDSFELLLKRAKTGEVASAVKLAVAYQHGQGVPQDHIQALFWYEIAAEKGNVIAMNNLGIMYALGQGAQVDMSEAAQWYRKAALKNLPVAKWNLSRLYASGAGLPKDEALALLYTREAADAGYPAAMVELGAMYQLGRALPQDHVRAFELYRSAAEKHFPNGIFFYGRAIYYGLGTPKDANTGIGLMKLAAQMGSRFAENTLGTLRGSGVDDSSIRVADLPRPAPASSTATDGAQGAGTQAGKAPPSTSSSGISSTIGSVLEVLAVGLLVGLLVVGASRGGGSSATPRGDLWNFDEPASSQRFAPLTRPSATEGPRSTTQQPLFREINVRDRDDPLVRYRGTVDRQGSVQLRRTDDIDPSRVYRGTWDSSGDFRVRDFSGREATVISR